MRLALAIVEVIGGLVLLAVAMRGLSDRVPVNKLVALLGILVAGLLIWRGWRQGIRAGDARKSEHNADSAR